MAKPEKAAIWSWFTGWINLVGHGAVTASIDFGIATILGFFFQITFWSSFAAKPWEILVIYIIVISIHGLLNTFGVALVALLNDISVWWAVIGTVVLVVLLFVMPPHTTSLSD